MRVAADCSVAFRADGFEDATDLSINERVERGGAVLDGAQRGCGLAAVFSGGGVDSHR